MRSWRFLTLLVILALLVGGCAQPAKPQNQAQEQKPPEQKQIELLWWTPFAGENSTKAWADEVQQAFEKESGIKVKRVDMNDEDFKVGLKTSFAGGNPPDLWFSWGGGILKAYVKENQVMDLTDVMKESWAQKEIPPNAFSGATFNGKLYGLPYSLWIGHFYINRDLFKKAGVTVPDLDKGETWTWDQFTDAIKKFKAAGVIPISVGGKESWELSFYYMYLVDRYGGSDLFADTMARKPGATFLDPAYVKAGERIQELVKLGAFQQGAVGTGYDDAERLFAQGKAAMYLMGTWVVKPIRDVNKDFPLDIIRFPTVPDGKGKPDAALGAVQTYYCISQASKNKEAAVKFLRFLAKPENVVSSVTKSGNFSPLNVELPKGAYDPVLEKAKRDFEHASHLQMAWDQYSPPKFASAHLDAVAAVFGGQMTPQKMAETQEQTAQDLAKSGDLP